MVGSALGLLCQEMLNGNDLDIRKRLFLQRMVGCWNRLSRHWSWPQPFQSSRSFWITFSGTWWGCCGDLCSTRNWTWCFQLRIFCDFHGTARQTSQCAKACLEELVQMIYLCTYMLSKSWQAECPCLLSHCPVQPCSKGSGQLLHWEQQKLLSVAGIQRAFDSLIFSFLTGS